MMASQYDTNMIKLIKKISSIFTFTFTFTFTSYLSHYIKIIRR